MSNISNRNAGGLRQATNLIVPLYLLLVVLAGSLLGFGLFLLTDYPYEKLLSRSILLFSALGLYPVWRLYGLTATSIGLLDSNQSIAGLARIYAIGLVSILPLMLFFVVVGFRVWDPTVFIVSADFLRTSIVVFFSAWLVGVFEETLFRGVMFTALRRNKSFATAALVTSLLYAAVHFLTPAEEQLSDPSWLGGIPLVIGAFAGLFQTTGGWDSFVALTLLGLLFCWVREQLGLWAAIALHSAFVCGLRIFKELMIRDIVNPYAFLVGDYDHFVGILVAFWLLFGFVVIALYRQHMAIREFVPEERTRANSSLVFGSRPKKEANTD